MGGYIGNSVVGVEHPSKSALNATTGDFTGAVDIDGSITSSAGATITTADNNPQLTLESTDADANFGPVLKMHRNSSSPADSDFLGEIQFQGENDAGEAITYAQMFGRTVDVSDSTEDGRIATKIMIAGTAQNVLDIKSNEIVINDDSVDLDFRVEGNGNANALFVQGSDDFIGIGTGTPKKKIHIQDTTSDGIILLDRNGTTTDHQICFAHNYQSGSQSGGNYFGIGVDGSENKLVFAFDANSQASLSADAKMVLDSSGNLNINQTSSTGGKLNVSNASGTWAVTLVDAAENANYVEFRDSSGNQHGYLKAEGAGLALNVGSAGGIDFSATSNVSGMTSELLDDYEEGTWTPTFDTGYPSGDPEEVVSNAAYTKIGNTVVAVARIQARNDATGMQLGGLPFNSNGDQSGGTIAHDTHTARKERIFNGNDHINWEYSSTSSSLANQYFMIVYRTNS